jgi:hypothetical protein
LTDYGAAAAYADWSAHSAFGKSSVRNGSKEWVGPETFVATKPASKIRQSLMPTVSREVRPRNFPPRQTSGASRRFFSAICLLAALATPAGALDLALPLATFSVEAEPAPMPDPIRVRRADFTYETILPVPVRLPHLDGSRMHLLERGVPPIELATYRETSADASNEDRSVEEISPPEPVEDLRAANDFGLKPMSAMSINIALPKGEGGHPEDFATARFDRERTIDPAQDVGRDWATMDYRWEASMLCHGPLLFEQLNAERYGITYGCLQPVVSGAHFFATVPTIPYKVWANGHDQCQYALGYYRPGSYARPQCYKLRVSADASLFEAGIILGLIFALP